MEAPQELIPLTEPTPPSAQEVRVAEKTRLLAEYLKTNQGWNRIAESMVAPIQLRIDWQDRWLGLFLRVGEHLSEADFQQTWTLNFQTTGHTTGEIEKLMSLVRIQISDLLFREVFLDVLARKAADETPDPKEPLNEDSFSKFVGDHEPSRPAQILMNPKTYTVLRKGPSSILHKDSFDPEAQMTVLQSGLMGTWYQCAHFIAMKNLPEDRIFCSSYAGLGEMYLNIESVGKMRFMGIQPGDLFNPTFKVTVQVKLSPDFNLRYRRISLRPKSTNKEVSVEVQST